MTSLKEYQEQIDTLAKTKGWSDDLHWLQLGIFKELGELVQEMEKYEDTFIKHLKTNASHAYVNSILAPVRTQIAKEFGDVIFFLFQAMHHYNIDLDEALEFVIKDNTEKRKKTIDKLGNIVRK